MKRPKKSVEKPIKTTKRAAVRHARSRDHVTEMLKLCLEKVCELQADLNRGSNNGVDEDDGEEEEVIHDPEAAGYAACAVETLRFLSEQGLPPDHPMVQILTEKLIQNNGRD